MIERDSRPVDPLPMSVSIMLPLDLVCVLSLLHRGVPDSHLDPWMIETRARLSPELRENLDLLHGFSGQYLYYVEEPAIRFRPFDPDRSGATMETFVAFLLTLPAAEYLNMAADALRRVYDDLGLTAPDIDSHDPKSWRAALEPALTTATMDETLALLAQPTILKRRTIDLFTGVWEEAYRSDFEANLPALREAVRLGKSALGRDFVDTFTILTGHRPSASLLHWIPEVERVMFCPNAHLGANGSMILYPPDLIVDFGAPEFLIRSSHGAPPPPDAPTGGELPEGALLDIARALADPNRLRILSLLADGERYAQEIVAHLGVAQSAVSRHLSQLQRAGIVDVTPRRGSKYYSINVESLDALAMTFQNRGDTVRDRQRRRSDESG